MSKNISNNINSSRNQSIDYFKAFLMVLVVWHHATLAYGTAGVGVLISDQTSFVGFDLIALYNDFFFMFAFFFVSGLFSYKSLAKKGPTVYLGDRLIRLLLPFSFGVLFINPISHYFSSIKNEGNPFSLAGYWKYFVDTFGKTEANHLWFLWVLFLFSVIITIYWWFKKAGVIKGHVNVQKYVNRAFYFTMIMIAASLILFLPLRNIAAGGFVTIIKPFNMQVSRILLYLLYFIAGNVVGTYGMKESFFFQEKFQKKWWLWILLSVLSTFLNLVIHIVQEPMKLGVAKEIVLILEQGMLVIIIIFAVFGFVGLFTGHIHGRNKIMDLLAKEAMGIYVIHYAVVTTLQYVFTFLEGPAIFKGIFVTILTLFISLGLVTLLKKVPVLGIVFGDKYDAKYGSRLIIITMLLLLVLILR